MNGLMMERPLLVSDLLAHAAAWHGEAPIVSADAGGQRSRTDYRGLQRRALRLARALRVLDVMPGTRVATLAWNDSRHLELYFAIPGIGAICHTINPRLSPAQIAWIVDHAQDAIVFHDAAFDPIVEAIRGDCPSVRHWIALGESIGGDDAYERLLAAHPAPEPAPDWPSFDERSAASLCYTSGTTGDPKGVLYAHRSTLLHAQAICLPDSFAIGARDVIMPIVPMFHVNAWGLPHAAAMTGAALALPGPRLDGESLVDLMGGEGVTLAAGVPTVWQRVLAHLQAGGTRPPALERIVIGGSAPPPAMVETFEHDFGVVVIHAWGMTETSPLGVVNVPRRRPAAPEVACAQQPRQGRPPFGIDLQIAGPDGGALPHDGIAQGELRVRGHWVASGYYRDDTPRLRDGWFPTGDIATIDADGFMAITDRVKDVIKSGGEWISSIALENAAAGCPGIAEAAVIGMPDAQWGERPLLVVVAAAGSKVSGGEVLDWLRARVPRWWVPARVEFAAELPHTATGKVSKLALRTRYR